MARIGLVGTGPSALYTLQGLVRSRTPLEIVLFEVGETAGLGTPYNPDTTDPAMLANIASIELPPLGITLAQWLGRLPKARRAELGIPPGPVDTRSFLPRIVLGAYFQARLEAMIDEGHSRGHRLEVRTRHRVVDVLPLQDGARLLVQPPDDALVEVDFDRVVIATGHRGDDGSKPPESELPGAYTVATDQVTGRVGMLGTSLSALDVAVAVAMRHGRFQEEDDGTVSYLADPERPAFHLTLMSRRGVLPEADFHYPIPPPPLPHLTRASVDELLIEGRTGLLDRAFALFVRAVQARDRGYAMAVRLSGLTADTYPAVYFGSRLASDPMVHARENFAEVRANAAAQHTVAWKLAILQAHEIFARLVPHFDERDTARFAAGLQSVFIDNYTAVPPQTIARLLALHDAGRLSIRRLGTTYSVTRPEAGSAFAINCDDGPLPFDHLIDARGQSSLRVDDLPFPSLRLRLRANHAARTPASAAGEPPSVSIEPSYALASGLNPIRHIYFLSLPFLLHHNPFIQGLCSARDMGRIVARHLLASIDGAGEDAPDDDEDGMERLLDTIRADRQPLYCLDSGLVVLW